MNGVILHQFFACYSPVYEIHTTLCESYKNTRKRQQRSKLGSRLMYTVQPGRRGSRCDAMLCEIREHRGNGRDMRKGGRGKGRNLRTSHRWTTHASPVGRPRPARRVVQRRNRLARYCRNSAARPRASRTPLLRTCIASGSSLRSSDQSTARAARGGLEFRARAGR